MSILCYAGLTLALLIGGLLGQTLTTARYDRIAFRRRQYEAEAAEYREYYAALALYRRVTPHGSGDNEKTAA